MSLPPLFQGSHAPVHRFGEGRRVEDLLNLTPRNSAADTQSSRKRTPSHNIKGPTPPTTTATANTSPPTRLNTCNTVSTNGRGTRRGRGGGASRSPPNRLHSPPKASSPSTTVLSTSTTSGHGVIKDTFGTSTTTPNKKKAIVYVEERTKKGISVHPVGDNETRLGSTLVGSEASRIRAQEASLCPPAASSPAAVRMEQQRDAIMLLASRRNEDIKNSRIQINESAHHRFYTPPTPRPPSPIPPADVSDRIAFVNCAIVPRGLVCLDGSDIFKTAFVLLRCQLLCYSPTSDSPPTLISTSSVPLELVREYQRSSASFLSMSGTATDTNSPVAPIPSGDIGGDVAAVGGDDDEAASLVLLRPQYVGTAKSNFCEMVKEEERDSLLSSSNSQNMSAAVREATVAKALHLRLNSLEYVHYLQTQHEQHHNVFTPAELTAVGDEGTRLISLFTIELSNTMEGGGEQDVEVLACDIELPRPEDTTTDRLHESRATTTDPDDGGRRVSSTPSSTTKNMIVGTPSWNTWWCVNGNPDLGLTETTCIDGTSNPRLQKRSVLGSFGITMRKPDEDDESGHGGSAVPRGGGGGGGQLCINVGRLPATKTVGENGQPDEEVVAPEEGHVAAGDVSEIVVDEDEFGMEGEYDDALDSGMLEEPPTPYFLHIGSITMDRTLMEQTLGTAEAYHSYRRSASMEASMSWRRNTNASIRITIDPHYPGLPQSLLIPVEPREEEPSSTLASSNNNNNNNNGGSSTTSKGVTFKASDRAVLVPEYVRRAEDKYLAIHFPNDDSKVVLDAGDRQSATYQEFMAAEHERQEWKIPIKRTHGELKLTATLQLQGAGVISNESSMLSASHSNNNNNTSLSASQRPSAPVMTQGARYLDMRACYKAVSLYAKKVSSRQDAANEEGVDVRQYGPNIKQPALRLSLLSLKHSFGGDIGGGGIDSKDRSEITLVGNVLSHARQELLHTTPPQDETPT